MKTNDGAWAALTPDATPGVSFVTNAPLEASAHPRCLSDAGFSAAVVLNTGIDYVPICVEIKFYGAFVLNRRFYLYAIDATPAPVALVDFHTGTDGLGDRALPVARPGGRQASVPRAHCGYAVREAI